MFTKHTHTLYDLNDFYMRSSEFCHLKRVVGAIWLLDYYTIKLLAWIDHNWSVYCNKCYCYPHFFLNLFKIPGSVSHSLIRANSCHKLAFCVLANLKTAHILNWTFYLRLYEIVSEFTKVILLISFGPFRIGGHKKWMQFSLCQIFSDWKSLMKVQTFHFEQILLDQCILGHRKWFQLLLLYFFNHSSLLFNFEMFCCLLAH